jgi:hypothetical protein
MSFFKKEDPVPVPDGPSVPSQVSADPKESQAAPEPKSNFIDTEKQTIGSEDIFQSLGENFLSGLTAPQEEKKKQKKTRLEIAAISMNALLVAAIVGIVATGVDSTLRGLEDPGYLQNFPVCDYLSWGIDGYENADCKSLQGIIAEKDAEKKQVEKTIVNNLLILVPKKLEVGDLLGSPEVQFVKERTGDSRKPLSKMIESFMELTKMPPYQGEDIECDGFKLTEKGEMEVNCEFYGDALSSFGNSESKTSRITAIKFLQNLESSEFRILNPPKSLDIQKFSSPDAGIRSTFSTVTRVQLKLRYVPSPSRS